MLNRYLRYAYVLLLALAFGLPLATLDAAPAAPPAPVAPAPATSPASLPTYTNAELLAQMLVVDVSERALDGVPAIAVTFSQDLAPTGSFDPFVTLTEGGKAVTGSWVLASEARRLYFTNIKPQTEYRVQVRPGVPSKNALELQQAVGFTVKTQDVQPAFDFASKGSVLPAKLTSGLPIRVVNVPEVDVEFLRVLPEKLPELLKTVNLGERITQWQLNEVNSVTSSVYASRYVTDAKPNARTTAVIPVESIKELQTPGLYFAVMRQPGHFDDAAYRITHFIVTNIGLHVRLYPHGVEVFANALDTGKPLADVGLKLQGEKEALQLRTDAQGHASFVHRPAGDLLLVADQAGQLAMLDMREPALDLSEYSVAGALDQPLAPFVYSTRDLFRPGEPMDLSVLLRDRDGKPVAVNNLNLKIVRPDTKVMLEENLSAANTKLGYFSYRLAIPADAPTGSWKAEVRINAKDASLVTTFKFHVEEFMPERMKLSLTSAHPALSSGEKLVVAVQGDYLYGAPASGNKFTSVRTVSVNRHPLEALKEFHFGDPADEKLVGREDLPELQLDGKGHAALEVPALEGKINSPLTLKVIGSLHETGGRAVTRVLDTAFWPKQQLVGIRPAFANDTADTNTEAGFELARVDPTGKVSSSAQPLAVTLVREEKEYFWEYNDAEGWKRKDVSSEYPLLQQKITLDAQARGKASFAVQSGYYRLEVEDAETGLKTVYPFHAGWDWEQEASAAARPDQIGLALDKAAYKAGDKVQLKITPPSAGEAIVAVEGGFLLWSQHVSLPAAGATVEIPVDAAWDRHDLYITVTSFRPASSQQKIAPNRALGVVYLPLDRAARKLDLGIEAPAKILPEQTTRVVVSSPNLAGESALVTLSAVDAGVLSITDFKTPDPFSYYFSQHGYGANLYDAYGKIIEAVDGNLLRQRFGGDAAGRRGGTRPQAEVNIVSLFSGAVKFDAAGKANIDVPIPGFDGTIRLMAVAASADRFGSAEREMVVASPVVASLAGPRFLAAGDSSFLTLDLNNTTPETQTVSLKIGANALFKFTPVAQDITLAKGKRQILRLPIAAAQAFGVGRFELSLAGKGFNAHRALQLAVRPAYPAKHSGQAQELAKGASMAFNASVMQGFLPAGLKANLTVSATPPLPLRSALDGLLQYPYGCLEQTTSTAWPYLFLEANVSEALGLPPMDMQERNKRVQSAILRLAGMQLANGSFSLWSSHDSQEEFWLTPYAVDFLLDAKDRGFVVPEWLLKRAITNLQERLQEGERYVDSRYDFSDEPAHADLAARAYAGYVLSRLKQAPLGTLRTIYDQDAGKAASGLPLVHLGLALNAQGDKRRGDEAIQKGLAMVRDDAKYLGDYGSPLRDQAAVLYVLMKNNVPIPGQAAQINKLADMLHNRSYLSTQEQLFTFLAGLKVLDKETQGWKATLKLGASAVDLAQKRSFTKVLTNEELAHGVEVISQSDAPVYVALNLDGYPDAAPVPRKDPIDIQREWYNLQGKKLQPKDIKAGDLLVAHLLITSKKAINDALVVDLVPAGLEVENTNLANNESLSELKLEGMDKPVPEMANDTTTRYQEYRDDRYIAALKLEEKAKQHLFYLVRVVSNGNFVVPPAYVEDMYRPELNGVGVAQGVLPINSP